MSYISYEDFNQNEYWEEIPEQDDMQENNATEDIPVEALFNRYNTALYRQWLAGEGAETVRISDMKSFTPWLYADTQISEYAKKYKGSYNYGISNAQEIYNTIYENARGIISIKSSYKAGEPVFVRPVDLLQDANKTLKYSKSNFENRKISLCTYQAVKGKKTFPTKSMIIGVSGIAVEIKKDIRKKNFDGVISSPNVEKVCRKIINGQIQVPCPTYYVRSAKDYLVYLFETPICLITTPQKRKSMITMLECIAQGIADKITSPTEGVFAVPVKLNGYVPAPNSYAAAFSIRRMSPSMETMEQFFEEMPDKVERALIKHDGDLEKACQELIKPELMFTCIDKGMTDYTLLDKKYTLDFLAQSRFEEILAEDKKDSDGIKRNETDIHISLRPSKHGNIYDMLINRMNFIRKVINWHTVDTDTALKYYWIYANQAFKSHSKAYKALERLFISVHKKAAYTAEIVEITATSFEKHHTHKHFLEALGFTKKQALKKGFKMRTEEELKEYQREYHKIYFRLLREKRWASEGCKYYAEVKRKNMEKAFKLYKNGWSLEKIAKRIGKSSRTAYQYILDMKKEESSAAMA